jgi:hypothetical protein
VVIVLAGRRIDAADTVPPRFPAGNESVVSTRVRHAFEELGATVIVCSAACGADLVALEVAGAMKLRRRVVLPWDRETFRGRSVVDRGEAWGTRYDRVMDEVDANGHLRVLSINTDDDAAFTATNHAILSQARELARAEGENSGPVAVLVWEGWSPAASGFTNDLRENALELGFRVYEVSTR